MNSEYIPINNGYCDICNIKQFKFACGSCGKRYYCSWKCRAKDFFVLFHCILCDQSLE
jgi:MoaA/NifB/PqqE/SkfB family radical SAM enzyme